MTLNIFINDEGKVVKEEVTKSDDRIKLFTVMKFIAAYEDLLKDPAILRFAKIQWQMIGLCEKTSKNNS